MSKFFAAAAAVVSLALVANAGAALVINEVMSSSGSGGTNDWFEIRNTGPAAVDITGYKMDDNSFAFANSVALLGVTSIAAGEAVVFTEDTAGDAAATAAAFKTFWGLGASAQVGAYLGTGAGVSLSATADGVALFTGSGVEVTRVTFGAATPGSSFDYTTGTPAISSVGTNGAFATTGTPVNIGSPAVGTVVPEPTALAPIAVAGLALARRRR